MSQNTYRIYIPRMCDKIIHWDIHFLSTAKSFQSLTKQLKVKGIGMIKVVLISVGCFVFFLSKYLQANIKANWSAKSRKRKTTIQPSHISKD